MDAEIIAIGSELLTPYRQDTNSLYLTERLNHVGVEVRFKDVVGDRREDLVSIAKNAIARADIVIFMGGLGPTEDDLTRECVAHALGVELHRDAEIVAWLRARFASRHMSMPDNNLRQADVIDGALVLPNAKGTAPGQWIEKRIGASQKILMLLPGPPWELKAMFEEQCVPRLRTSVPPQVIATRLLKIALMPESQCDALVAPIYKRHTEVETTILAARGEIQLHLRSRAATQDEAEARVQVLADELLAELGDFVFTVGNDTLEKVVGNLLQQRGATIAVAESCTGGLLSQRITMVSGSSAYFLGGAVVYSNGLKTVLAGVPAELIASHGAVSREVAAALAQGIRDRCGAKIGIGITGIAGPSGATPEKPVGLVFHSIADARGTDVLERTFPGDRERVRLWASQQALDMLRRRLMHS
jgi:nicotinamide-nucleotide amidase